MLTRHRQAQAGQWTASGLLTLLMLLPMPLQAQISPADFTDCTIGNDSASITADCTTVSVPFDPALPDGETINVFVARISARHADPKPDPVLLLAGGPGQAATETFPALLQAFRYLARDRDLILVDQRGTGRSDRLDCPQSETPSPVETDPQEVRRLSAACQAALQRDTTRYTTSVAVQDLERIRKWLGIRHWNLYGVSYGTRVALHYLRRFPDPVRSVILDAAVPPDVALGSDLALHAQRALDHILARCHSDPDCHAAFPAIDAELQGLLQELADAPQSVTFEDVATGRQRTLRFTSAHLQTTLRLMSYSAFSAAILPSMLHEAATQDNFVPLARQALLQIDSLENALSIGLNSAVICTEDAPWFGRSGRQSPSSSTYLGDDLIDAMQAGCEPWPRGLMDDDFREPLRSDKPVLILSGEADPITPPEYGERLLQTLSNAIHLVNPGQGHMQAPLGCTPLLMARFIAQADGQALATDCLQRLQPPAFFVDANGSKP